MPLTPLDIYNKEFRRALRGYHEDEVNEFLDEVVRDYEAVLRENDEMKQQLAGINERVEQYKKLEESVKNALIVAQATADEVRQAARKEAELIVREAEAKAQALIEAAERRVREQEEQLEALRREWDIFRARMRSMLQTQLALLSDEPAPEPRTAPPLVDLTDQP